MRLKKLIPDVAQIPFYKSLKMEGSQIAWVGKVDFRNTILIMTSNVGAHILTAQHLHGICGWRC
jgi:hypothetical protein